METAHWKYRASIYTKRDHCTLYRDDALGVQMQVMIKREWFLFKPRERVFYFVDNVSRAFRSEQEMMRIVRSRRPARRRVVHDPVWELVSGKVGA